MPEMIIVLSTQYSCNNTKDVGIVETVEANIR